MQTCHGLASFRNPFSFLFTKKQVVDIWYDGHITRDNDIIDLGQVNSESTMSITLVVKADVATKIDSVSILGQGSVSSPSFPLWTSIDQVEINLSLAAAGSGTNQNCVKIRSGSKSVSLRFQYEIVTQPVPLSFVTTGMVYNNGGTIQVSAGTDFSILLKNNAAVEASIVGYQITNSTYQIRQYPQLPLNIPAGDMKTIGVISPGSGSCVFTVNAGAYSSSVTISV